jgi:hypothetical protein
MRQPLNFLSCDHLEKLFGSEYQALKKVVDLQSCHHEKRRYYQNTNDGCPIMVKDTSLY